MSERPRLDEHDVAGRLELLEELLGELEKTSGPTAEQALDAVATLAEVYGEALARVMDRVAAYPELGPALAEDVLLAHLLALHRIGGGLIPVDSLARGAP